MLHVLPLRRAAVLAAAAVTLFLAACGGGGGGSGSGAAVASRASVYAPSASLENMCSAADQKLWIRSYLDEVYLWSDEVREVEAAAHATPAGYFYGLLVDARDRFSFTMSSLTANLMQGITAAAPVAAGGSAASAVPLVRTHLSATGRKVGYLLFNEHSLGAQDRLITAFTTLRNANVQDLVLDLRYNSGGFLYVSQAAAAMVAGPGIQGQVFESLRYNPRRLSENPPNTFFFSTRVQVPESTYPVDHELPQLSLPRLYVLTSQLTCSASESIINSLRGIGVQVILVGDRTCGKPYGFYRKDNCGQAYFPIEFQVYNAAGFGDYQDGFAVQCRVEEDPASPLGNVDEPLLSAALRHIDTGSCPAGTATGVEGLTAQASAAPLGRPGAPPAGSAMYRAGFNGRILQP